MSERLGPEQRAGWRADADSCINQDPAITASFDDALDALDDVLDALDETLDALDESRRRAENAEQRLDCLATLFKHAPLQQLTPGGPMFVTFSTAAFQMAYDGGDGETVWREPESTEVPE